MTTRHTMTRWELGRLVAYALGGSALRPSNAELAQAASALGISIAEAKRSLAWYNDPAGIGPEGSPSRTLVTARTNPVGFEGREVMEDWLIRRGYQQSEPGHWTRPGSESTTRWIIRGRKLLFQTQEGAGRKHEYVTRTTYDMADFAETLLRTRMMSPAGTTRLRIDSPGAIVRLSHLEGVDWLGEQEADRAALSDPLGFYSNLAAFTVLRDMGPQAAGLIVSDLIPGAGVIAGGSGRAYAVMPDGEVALIGESADRQFRDDARFVVRVL